IGNCGVAAHRGRAKWYFFNRLDELTVGDSIFVNYNGTDYEYVVYETLVVLPHQVEVLNRSRTKKILTLITCDPPESDQYRLIVHAILK
ncbi:MAG: sortase, partial [Bacillota bacterium]|nr:sortase [Bacillota bacterium]